MKIELADDGYEKIDAKIRVIEALAYNGRFMNQNKESFFQRISSEAKLLRQALREVLLLVPDTPAVTDGKGDAA